QAEDGIRDKLVTGVQTCALPISVPGGAVTDTAVGRKRRRISPTRAAVAGSSPAPTTAISIGGIATRSRAPRSSAKAVGCWPMARSEERRVGKGGGWGGGAVEDGE